MLSKMKPIPQQSTTKMKTSQTKEQYVYDKSMASVVTDAIAIATAAEKLAEACEEARDWLRRSCRIDDQEQADDLNAALEVWQKAQGA